MRTVLAITVVQCLLLSCSATGAELVNLDAFIGGIEKADGKAACKLSAPISDLWEKLNRRYFPDRNDTPATTVQLPAKFAAAFGKAAPETRKGEGLTRIRVPLSGTYRGLRVRRITFDRGIENGISIVYVLFDASKSDVESVLGPDLSHATAMSWGSTKIVTRTNGTEFVCDRSS